MRSNKPYGVASALGAAGITYLLYHHIVEGRIYSKYLDVAMDEQPVLFWLAISAGAALVAGCLVAAVAFWRLVDPPT